MTWGNGQGKKPVPVREKFPNRPVPPPLDDYVPAEHKPPPVPGYDDPVPVVRMDQLTKEIQRDRIREIALLTVALTYGEMCTYEGGLEAAGASADLKSILHKWALEYLKKDDPP